VTGGSEPQENAPTTLFARYRQLGLGARILIWMVLGVVAGIALGEPATAVEPIGQLFIRLLLMSAIPLVFFNLLAGLTSLVDVATFGRLAVKVVSYYLLTTTMALIIGLTTVNMLAPGRGVQLSQDVSDDFGSVPSVVDVLLDLVPENIFQAFASGSVAQIVVFAVFLGIATLFLPEDARTRLGTVYADVAEVLRKLVDIVLKFGPIGIGALAAATVGEYGSEIFGPLLLFLVGVWGAQAAMVVIYMVLLLTLTRFTPASFLRQTGTLWATTAATCSSLASLAVALKIAQRMGLPRTIYSFTLPLGAQINKDGTSIMLAAVLMFTAQAAGVEFSLGAQAVIVLVGLLLSEGSGGIPGGGLVIALIFVQAFNLPLEIAAIVGGIYRLIDMGSTTINVMGDMVGTAIIARSEEGRFAGETT
jgi:Na+/H+-dicarboxylate symporter